MVTRCKNKITSTSVQKSRILSESSPMQPKSAFQNLQMTMAPSQMMTMAPQIAYTAPEQELEEPEPEYVRIGDQIRVEFNEKVFDGLKEYAKIEGGKDNMRLAKILEKPDFEYKGIMYSDGIVNKEIKLGTDESFNDKNKSIFRIEVVQDYKFTQQFNDLKIEVSATEDTEYENPDEEKEKDLIFEDIKLKYKKELKANASEQKYKSGSKLLYGQVIQLKHIASGLYLTLDNKRLSSQYGCFELHLSPCNENSRFKLIPAQEKTKQMHEPITYDDGFVVQNAKEPSDYYLHCDSTDLYLVSNDERKRIELPVNASHGDVSATNWKFTKYLLKNTEEKKKNIKESEQGRQPINTMDAIRIMHREIGGYLTVSRREVIQTLPDYPDYLKKEVAALAKEKDDLDEEDEELILEDKDEKNSQGIKVSEILIYIEKDSSKLDKTNSLWEIQKVGTIVGDDLFTNEKYLIRHLGTGMFLSTTDNIELSLTSQSTNIENEFRFKDEQMSDKKKNKLYDKSLVCLQNIDDKYVQTYIDAAKDQFSYIKNRNISTEVPVV